MLSMKSIIFDNIDKSNSKIDKYRLLTATPFIVFCQFRIHFTNFIYYYRILSVIDFIDCPRRARWPVKTRIAKFCTHTSLNHLKFEYMSRSPNKSEFI